MRRTVPALVAALGACASLALAWVHASPVLGAGAKVASTSMSMAPTSTMGSLLVPEGVPDAGPLSITPALIREQNADADRVMDEQGMTSQMLPGGIKRFTLVASEVNWYLYPGKSVVACGYNGQVPGPVIRVRVGDRVQILLKNELNEPTTLNFPGLPLPASQLGIGGVTERPVPPGGERLYSFTVTPDMVGTHLYESGTDMASEIDQGLHGVLLVDPARGPLYPFAKVDALFEIDAWMVDGSTTENAFGLDGKPYPNAPQLTVPYGSRVVLRIVNASSMCYHAMHVHETTFWLLAEDGHPLPVPRPMNVLAIAPGETADIEFPADVRGDWMFHCHILDHMMNPDDEVDMMGGLVTFIHVK
ncbi:multicopper oxidase domain-containing protein [Alicyclobacillus acidocaldarius]|uniref:Multicopper oxidase type 3 n=1 Tax=Alicyclobacillus acidocaldarius (strain Tc-4-1) TaxID=1048834 RepID=F8IIW6_ALIAT|nr:copper oxidase [Alicyclobacillus acidocaldarius]AEJ44641.1 multicopper oxidase type 3 [Alicyclobacillus acidocaldarius subsp. acidocaldarius Tc-4-1]